MSSLSPLLNDLTVQTPVAAAAVVQSEIVQGRRFSLLNYLMRSEITGDTITIESKIKLFIETILPRLSCASFFNENGVITDSWQRAMQLSGFKITPFCDEAVFPPEHIFNIIQYINEINLISCTSDFKPVISFLDSISSLFGETFSKDLVTDAVGVIVDRKPSRWGISQEIIAGLQKIKIAIDAGSTLKKVYILVDSEKQQKQVEGEIEEKYTALTLNIEYVLAEKHSMSSENDGVQLLHLIKDKLVGQQILLSRSDIQKNILEILDGSAKSIELLSFSQDIREFAVKTLIPIKQYLREGVKTYEKANPSIALQWALANPTGDCFTIVSKILELLKTCPLETINSQLVEKFIVKMKELGTRYRNKFYAPVSDCIGELLLKKKSIESVKPFFTEILTAGLSDLIKTPCENMGSFTDKFDYFISNGADPSKIDLQDLNTFKETMERRSERDAHPSGYCGRYDPVYHEAIQRVFSTCGQKYDRKYY